jgi:two-component system response regulator RegA
LKAVSERLALKGFEVTTAAGGNEAVEAAKKGGFDVAVLDLQMPDIDGAQVLKILKRIINS